MYIYIYDEIEWILIGRGGRQSSVGRRRFTNLGQNTVSCSPHISGGHWQFEAAMRNCHFISAGNRARKWNGLLFLDPLSVFFCVRTWVLWFFECWELNSKSRLHSGAKYSCTRPPREAENHRNNSDADMVVKLWVTDYIQYIYKAVCAGVWRYPRAFERSD